MPKRNVGQMGENELLVWAAAVGITANKAGRDETGWDFFLEFHPHHIPGGGSLPLDAQPKPLQCLLQVKATDGRAGRIAVKLDNWLRAVKTALPVFFLVLEYDGKPTCQRAFLVHVGEDRIREVLKRLRELSAAGSTPQLHRHSLSLRYSPDDELASPGGASLEEAITRHVGPDPALYERRKQAWIDTVGYEGAAGELKARMILPADDPEGHLVDFALGRVPEIELAGGEYRDVRFGIAAAEPMLTIPEGGLLRGGVFVQETILRFRWKPGRHARMKASVYSPRNVAGVVRREALRFRISNPFLELVAGLSRVPAFTFQLATPGPDDELALSDLHDFAEFLLLFDEASRGPEPRIVLRFRLDAAPQVDQEFVVEPPPIDARMLAWARTIQQAWRIAEFFGVQDETCISGRGLMGQFDALREVDAMLRSDPAELRATLRTREPFAEPGREICLPWTRSVRLGAHRLVVPAAWFGPPGAGGVLQPDTYWYEFSPTRVEVTHAHLIAAGAPFGEDQVRHALESVAAEHADRWEIVRWWDPGKAEER